MSNSLKASKQVNGAMRATIERIRIYMEQSKETILAQQEIEETKILHGDRTVAILVDSSGSSGLNTPDPTGVESIDSYTILKKEKYKANLIASEFYNEYSQYGKVRVLAYTFSSNADKCADYQFDSSGKVSNDPYRYTESSGFTYLYKGLSKIRADLSKSADVEKQIVIITDGEHTEDDSILLDEVNKVKSTGIDVSIVAVSTKSVDLSSGAGVFSIATMGVTNCGGEILTPDGQVHIVGVQKKSESSKVFTFMRDEYPSCMTKFVLSTFCNHVHI